MSTAEEFEGYAQEIAGDDGSWEWEVNFQIETIPSIDDSGFLSGEDKQYRKAEIRWTRKDISVAASISGWEVTSPDDWFTIASITQGDDRVSAEFSSKASTISGLKAALNDSGSLLGPFSSSLLGEIDRRTQGQFKTERGPTPWRTVCGVSVRNGPIEASLGYFRGSWNLTVTESEPLGERGSIVDYETLNRASLSFGDEGAMLDAIEQWAAAPRVFF
ncbi:hypothetical protein ACFR97_12065 [Haloplanus litoreus]|uniref:Uncharacterized protein n=1 Tax=Haloplanus litoreus TaxID=767515 RepID=A0ABD5ZZU8_9EURY